MAKVVCERCGKPLSLSNQVLVNGKLYGVNCAKDIRNLISLRNVHPELTHLCGDSFCTSCKKTFNCPLVSSLSNHIYQLDMFNDELDL